MFIPCPKCKDWGASPDKLFLNPAQCPECRGDRFIEDDDRKAVCIFSYAKGDQTPFKNFFGTVKIGPNRPVFESDLEAAEREELDKRL